MFDVGLQELFLIGLIGLVVIGPKRLPKLARTIGVYVGKMRRFVTDVRSDVERELRAEEFRQNLDVGSEIDDVKRAMEAATSEFSAAHDAVQDVQQELSATGQTLAETDGTTGSHDAPVDEPSPDGASADADALADTSPAHTEGVADPGSASPAEESSVAAPAPPANGLPAVDEEVTILNPHASMHRTGSEDAQTAATPDLPDADDEQTVLNRKSGQDAGSAAT